MHTGIFVYPGFTQVNSERKVGESRKLFRVFGLFLTKYRLWLGVTENNLQVYQKTSPAKDTDWQRPPVYVENKWDFKFLLAKITPCSQLYTLVSHLWCQCQLEWNYNTKKRTDMLCTTTTANHQHPGQRKRKRSGPVGTIAFLTNYFKSSSHSLHSDLFIFRFCFH